MARDRQRAKRRKEKRQPSPPAREPRNGGVPEPRAIHRENVPGPVEHSGDVDQFEAELVAGADGEPQADEALVERAALEADADAAFGREAAGEDADAAFGREPDREEAAAVPAVRGATAPTQDVAGRGAGRFVNFLRASWAELQRVQWPDRRQVGQATAVVLGFVIVAGAFLGAADWVATKLVDLVI